MARKEIGTGWDRENRNAMNDNFKELYAQKQIADNAEAAAKDAKSAASAAVTTAEQALSQSQDTQTQLDQIIVEGDSSVEAAAARVDEAGTAHTTLKARLDSGFTKVNQQLADTDAKLDEITVLAPPPSGGDDTAVLQAAINDLPNGSNFKFRNGTYNLNRSLENNSVSLDFAEKKGLRISGSGTKFFSSVDMTTANYSALRFSGCEDIVVEGIEFEVVANGVPQSRRNCRIINITTSPENLSTNQSELKPSVGFVLRNNRFKITHSTGYTNLDYPALYGVHAHTPESGNLRMVRDIEFTNNVFRDSDGRLFMAYLVDGVTCSNNKFYNCAKLNMTYVIRVIGASKNAIISDNYIQIHEGDPLYSGTAVGIMCMGGISGSNLPSEVSSINSENYSVLNNTIEANKRYNVDSLTGIYLVAMKNITIKGNTITQLDVGGDSNRGDAIRIIASSDGIPSENVFIRDNNIIGWKTWFFRNDEANLSNAFVENNNLIGDSASSAFYDPPQKIIRSRNRSGYHNRYLEENSGTYVTSGDGTATSVAIPHGLPKAPSKYQVNPRNNATGFAGIKYYSASATMINVYFNNALPNGTENISLSWSAEI